MVETIEARIQRITEKVRPRATLDSHGYRSVSLAAMMAQYAIPGISITMIDNGEIAWERAWGTRNTVTGEPVTTETTFQAGSISKPVAALAALRLAESGALDLKEDVNAYLQSWRVPDNDGWQPHLSLRQLLSHSAGLTVHGFPGYAQGNAIPSVTQILDGLPPANTDPVRVILVPGTQFRYSGGGTTIAQLLLSDRTGKPFPALMRELVLDPLGMRHSTYEQLLPDERHDEPSTGHRAGGQPIPGGWHIYPEMAAAGLWSTPSDLAHYVIGVMDAWHGVPGAILSQEMARQMLTPILPTPWSEGGIAAFSALGLFVNDDHDEPVFTHSGSDEGFTSLMVGLPARRQGVVMMTNLDADRGAEDLLKAVLRSVAVEYQWPDALPATQPAIGIALPPDPSVVGEYVLASGFRLFLVIDGGTLRLAAQSQPPLTLYRTSGDIWVSPTINTRVELLRDDTGHTSGFVLHQDGQSLEARRKR